jgi:hypothetical protein
MVQPIFGAAAMAATLTANSYSNLSIVGQLDNKIRGQLAIINQTYSDASTKRYLLADISVPVAPTNPLNIQTALTARLTISFTHPGGAAPYVECTLEPRTIRPNVVSFSFGLKSTGSDALIRWGVCDDPALPGHDSQFPLLQPGDTFTLKALNGPTIGQYTVPPAPANTSPATAAKQYAVVSLLEGPAYRVGQ